MTFFENNCLTTATLAFLSVFSTKYFTVSCYAMSKRLPY